MTTVSLFICEVLSAWQDEDGNRGVQHGYYWPVPHGVDVPWCTPECLPLPATHRRPLPDPPEVSEWVDYCQLQSASL